ncbi:hypothetical protein GY45DRAFT_1341491 [Cubamyces sp. BRFM 1775]|nr:hypothetical protein GY45DRAFT_1341491 [Cubamyces sp. BRFM 1775]
MERALANRTPRSSSPHSSTSSTNDRFSTLESRVSTLERKVDTIERKVDTIERKVDNIEHELKELKTSIDKKMDQMLATVKKDMHELLVDVLKEQGLIASAPPVPAQLDIPSSLTSPTSPVASQASPVASRVSPVASRISPVASRVSPVASRVSPVASQASPTITISPAPASPTTPATNPMSLTADDATPDLHKTISASDLRSGSGGLGKFVRKTSQVLRKMSSFNQGDSRSAAAEVQDRREEKAEAAPSTPQVQQEQQQPVAGPSTAPALSASTSGRTIVGQPIMDPATLNKMV